jgi:hypothetical protein
VFFIHVKQGCMLFVQTLALSTLAEYFRIYTKLFAETATTVPNLPEMHLSISSNPAAMEVIRIDRLLCHGLRSGHCRFLLGHPQGDLSR